MPDKSFDASHDIIGITQLPTGRIFLITSSRVYELDVHGNWNPMPIIAPAPEPAAASAPAAPAAPAEE